MIARIDRAEHTVRVAGLPDSLAGLRVAHLTDLHRGRLTPDSLLQAAVALVRAWQPDLVLLTGDFVGGEPEDLAPCINILTPLMEKIEVKRTETEGIEKDTADPAAAINTAQSLRPAVPCGVYAVAGNHDVNAGLERVRSALEAAGIVFLRNSNVRLSNGLWLAGLDEDLYGSPDAVRAFAGIPNDAPTLVLAHNPAQAELVADRRCVVFSGHTHGGQIRLPFLTSMMLRRIKAKHYRAGWYEVGKARLYVNRGLGNADVPFRFRCPPEVALFTFLP